MRDENERVRARAAAILGVLGPAATPALPALQAAAEDEHLMVREAVAEALRQLTATDGAPAP